VIYKRVLKKKERADDMSTDVYLVAFMNCGIVWT